MAVAVGGKGVAVGGIVVETAVAGTDGEAATGAVSVGASAADVGATAGAPEVTTFGDTPPEVDI